MTIPPGDQIVATFDTLVDEGVIVYGPHRVIEQDCAGYPIEFRVCPSLMRKPHTLGAALDPTFDTSRKWGPGSDLYCPNERLKIAKLNDTHELAFNMFCVDRPQFLILTLDSYRRQYEPLDHDDFDAALVLLAAMRDTFVIFNGGEAAGCTRVHKHLQGLSGPPRAFESFTNARARSKVPFRYFSHHFVEGFEAITGSQIAEIYRVLFAQAKESLGVPSATDTCPHNVVLWDGWIIVIPRRAAVLAERASANAAGMLGSIWVSDQSFVDDWTRLGCRHVLSELGIPN